MARPLPVNMLLAGTGAVLLVSGIGGQSIGDVLKGSFGKLEVKHPNIGSESQGTQSAAFTGEGAGGGQFAPSPVGFSGPGTSFGGGTVAPPPQTTFRGNRVDRIAAYLKQQGITNPTQKQVNEASYHLGFTTKRQLEESEGRLGGLPLT